MKYIIAVTSILLAACPAHAQPADPLPKLLKQLQTKNAEIRADALVALTDLGPKAEVAIPAIVNLLPGVHEEQRVLGAMALGKIGKASVPAVVKLLDHEDETTRFYAVWVLAIVGKDAQAQTERLLTLLAKDDDEEVRIKLIYALTRISPESKEVLAALTRWATDPATPSAERVAAIEELRHCGHGALAPLVKLLADDTKKLVERYAIFNQRELSTLMPSNVSTKATESIQHLFQTHEKSDEFARAAFPLVPALLTHVVPPLPILGLPMADDAFTPFLARHGDKVLAELEKGLRDKKSDALHEALVNLGGFATRLQQSADNPGLLKKSMAALAPYFKDPDAAVRQTVVLSTPYTEDARAIFEPLVFDEDAGIRMQVILKLQGTSHDPLPKLIAKMQAAKGDERLRLALIVHPIQNQGGEIDKLLEANLQHKDPLMRHRIACALVTPALNVVPYGGMQTKNSKWLAQVLLDGLKSEKEAIRFEAATALIHPQHPRHDLIPALLKHLDDPAPMVRSSLLLTIGAHHFGADARANLKKLLPNLDDKDESIRFHAIPLLGPVHELGVPHLARLAEKDPSLRVGEQACKQLAKVRPANKDAVAALFRVAEDKERWAFASAALVQIDVDANLGPVLKVKAGHDEPLRRALLGVDTTQASAKFLNALARDLKDSDHARRRDLAYLLRVALPTLSTAQQYEASFAIARHLQSTLTGLEKELKARDVRIRVEAATTLVELRRLEVALQPSLAVVNGMAPMPDAEKIAGKLQDERVQLQKRFEKLIAIGRFDAELAVRRQARKAEAVGHVDAPPWPFFGGFHPFMNPNTPRPIALPLLPTGFHPGGYGPTLTHPGLGVGPPV